MPRSTRRPRRLALSLAALLGAGFLVIDAAPAQAHGSCSPSVRLREREPKYGDLQRLVPGSGRRHLRFSSEATVAVRPL